METVKYWKKIRTQVAMRLINKWKIDQKVAENVCGVKL